MGAYLSSPVTEKVSEEGENRNFNYGVCAMQGWRTEMEDAHSVILEMETAARTGFFGVFDGHGGKEVAKYAALYLARELAALEEFQSGDMRKALGRAYLRMDELLVMEDQQEELRKLAGEQEQPATGSRQRRSSAPALVLEEAELPDVLREALHAARERMDERRARRARGDDGSGGGGVAEGDDAGDEDLEGVEEFDVADLIAMEFGGEDDDEEEDDPDYMPSADEDMASDHLVESGAEEAHLAQGSPVSSLKVRTGHSRRDIPVEGGGAEMQAANADGAVGSVHDTTAEEAGEEAGSMRNGSKRKRLDSPGCSAAMPNGLPSSQGGEGSSGHDAPEAAAAAAAAGAEGTAGAEVEDEELSSSDESEAEEVMDVGRQQQPSFRGPCAGCTAVVALVRDSDLWVANAGDSRCVASRRGLALALTHDHKPTDEEELQRISKAGGFVAEGRINGSLNLSRALGDIDYKQSKDLGPAAQMVTAVPEVRHLCLEPGDEFIILACDGIWDVLSNQQAVDFVRKRLAQRMSPRAICEALCDHCLAPDTGGCGKGCDNMSALVVVLKSFSPFSAAGDAAIDLSTLPPPPAPEEIDPMFLDHMDADSN